MSFERPLLLIIALFGALAFAALYRYAERRSRGNVLRYSNLAFLIEAARPRRWPRALLAFAWTCAVLLVLFALAGPSVRASIPVRGGTVVLCIDTSGSMLATDVEPTRAQAAISALRAFIDRTPRQTSIGIVSFAGSAQEIAAPTRDRELLQSALLAVPPPNGATAIGDALALARRMLSAGGHRVVVLITDGENNAGSDPMQQARALAVQGIRLYTIGIGTNSGTLIPGTLQSAGIDEAALREYARVTGGAYSRAADAAELRTALSQLSRTTAYRPGKIDISLEAAIAGACVMIVSFLWTKLI